ncbi:MAG: hypothetical protein IKP64_02685 [Selenomonadaceae bacterium]|nr:hypothetical protein [Selenomonadaceae bacterium]MBR4382444.1 hypothetical protein [Selenomonadaceae bacterium]
MKKILGYLALTIFGTFLLLYSVIAHEPPAFFAYAFGLINGLCWAGIVLMWWLRQDAEADEWDDLDEESDHARDK